MYDGYRSMHETAGLEVDIAQLRRRIYGIRIAEEGLADKAGRVGVMWRSALRDKGGDVGKCIRTEHKAACCHVSLIVIDVYSHVSINSRAVASVICSLARAM